MTDEPIEPTEEEKDAVSKELRKSRDAGDAFGDAVLDAIDEQGADTVMQSSDAVIAATIIVNRSGGDTVEFGFLNEEPPHQWWARARYGKRYNSALNRGIKTKGISKKELKERIGHTVIVEDFDTPDKAADALAARILDGGRCSHCGGTIRLLTSLRVSKGKACVWMRTGKQWHSGCGAV